MFKYFMWCVIALTVTSSMTAQKEEFSSVIHKSVSDGLVDRTVLKVLGDSLGTYYVQTPLAIQKYYQNEFIQTLSLSTPDQSNPMMEDEDHLFILNDNNCIEIIDKLSLSLVRTNCIDEHVQSRIQSIKPRDTDYLTLFKIDEFKYEIRKVEFGEGKLTTVLSRTFSFKDPIIAFELFGQKELPLVITDKDECYIIDKEPRLVFEGCRQKSTGRIAKIYVNQNLHVAYFSLMECPGVYKLTQDYRTIQLTDKGGIQVVSHDKKNNSLIGVTDSQILHSDYMFFVDSTGQIEEWPKILDVNKRIISFKSDDFEDNFIASTFNGIFYFDFQNKGVDLFLHQSDIKSSEFGSVVRSFCQIDNQEILIVNEGGHSVFQLENNDLSVNRELSDIIGYGTVWLDYNKLQQEVWILQYDRAGPSQLFKYNLITKQRSVIIYPFTAEKFHMDDQYIWITGRKGKKGIVARTDKNGNNLEYLFKDELSNAHVRASYYGKELYTFGTYEGLLFYDATTNKEVDLIKDQKEKLAISYISYENGKYYVGTYNKGLWVFDKYFSTSKHYNVSNSLSGNTVASIERDDSYNFWISTFSGIVVLDSSMQLVEQFKTTSGSNSEEYNRSASYKDNLGNLYFGSINGFLRINPKEFFDEKQGEKIILDEMTIVKNGERYTSKKYSKDNTINGIPEKLIFRFVNLGFSNLKSQELIRQLEVKIVPEVDSLYIQDGLVHITGLSTLNYKIFGKLRIQDAREYELASVQIHTDWSKIISNISSGLGAIVLTFLLMYRYFKNQQKKSEEKLLLKNEIIDVRLKALRSQLNPHFVFNALNSIQFYIQTNEKKLARNYLNKFARLIRLILESSHFDHISINKEIEQLSLYLDLEKLRFEDKWDYTINFEEYINQDNIIIPSMILQPIIENAVIHGMKNLTQRKGHIDINFGRQNDSIVVTIEDNGIGRVKANENRTNKNKDHKSLSTNISKTRINLLNSINPESYSIDYTDKIDKEGAPEGTMVTITFKELHHAAA